MSRRNEESFVIRIWGARGSLPASAQKSCDFGSHTCCVEMRCGGRVLIFDAGSGAELLGDALAEEGVRDLDLFFSHCHLDHIMGLPFLCPLYEEGVSARLSAGHLRGVMSCREMIERFMAPPFFPVTPAVFKAAVEYRDFVPGDVMEPAPGIRVSTFAIPHPGGAIGYRVDFAGRSACYVTDTEHEPGDPNETIIGAVRGADTMIYDCAYTDEEFDRFRGYGHSTWEEGVRLCEAADVRRLVLFHHRISRDDKALRDIGEAARQRFPGALVAATGLTIELLGQGRERVDGEQ